MSLWETVTWAVARAGGLTAYVLLTAAVVMGLSLSLRWQSARWPRLINNEWHNYLTLLSLTFVGVHVLAVWVDPFTHFGLTEIWIPLASTYRPQWMAFGIVGLYLGLAIGISTLLRPIIGYQMWRRLHVLTLVLYVLVSIHGIGTGSDTGTWWALSIYAISIGIVGTLVVLRLLSAGNGQQQRVPTQRRTTVPTSHEPRVLVPPRG
ncbi:MAG TPA: iron reductase [Ktedonobacterales bacterium]|nr:iron reductase [Ktedonobacterales bacterium]